MPRTLIRALLLACALSLGLAARARADDLTVSAAASLANAFKDVAPLFEAAQPGTRLRFNFGASGALLQQLARGAPVDVLATADTDTMDQAQAQGLVRAAQRRHFAANALVLVVPANAARVPATLQDLAQAGYQRIAIGVPGSVPAGRYAQAALRAARLWAVVQPKMIGAQNVRQALDYVARGEVDAGFVYATDAALMPDKVKLALRVPSPTPVLYPAAPVSASAHAALAQQFVEFLLSPPAQEVLARHGFGRP